MNDTTAITLCPEGVVNRLVLVNADVRPGAPEFRVTGPGGNAVHELRDRIYAGITNSKLGWLPHKVTVSLTPIGGQAVPACADLAVAAAVLAGCGHLPAAALDGVVFVGEVGLDGAVRAVPEVLGLVASAAELGYHTVVVPALNAAQARLVPGVQVIAASSVTEVVGWAITGVPPVVTETFDDNPPVADPDLPDLERLPAAWHTTRLALEVAAAGGHHLILAGSGDQPLLVARCLPSLLPDLDDQAALQVSALHAAAGLPIAELIRRPPLRAPHYACSRAALFGGRKPGDVSLAHRGVLLLHDAAEFAPELLLRLRQPLDSGVVRLARTRGVHTYPAAFQLVLTCRADDGIAVVRRAHRTRLAAIADHADMVVTVGGTTRADLGSSEPAPLVAGRVAAARAVARQRWKADGYATNADIPLRRVQQQPFRLPPPVIGPATRLRDTGAISAAGYGRVVRMAWTIADLAGLDRPGRDEVDQAIGLRRGEAHD